MIKICVKYISVLIFLFPCIIFGQDTKEQMSLDYFMDNIIKENYSSHKKVFFTKKTSGIASVEGPFSNCFSNSNFKIIKNDIKIENSEPNQVELTIKNKSIKILKKCRNNILNIQVNNFVNVGEFALVTIKVKVNNKFIDHYLIRIKENKVFDYCFVPEII